MIKAAFLSLVILMNAHALERKSAEYIVKGKSLTESAIKSTFKTHLPDQIRPLSKGHYLVRFNKDPGLKTLKKDAGNVFEIYPNQGYKGLK